MANLCWLSGLAGLVRRRPGSFSSLLSSYEAIRKDYIGTGRNGSGLLKKLDAQPREKDLYRTSAAFFARMSPWHPLGADRQPLHSWGFNKGDEDLGGYHLVWPRDLVETAGGLSPRAQRDARRVLALPGAPRKPMDVGRRTCGSTARLIGMASRWTRPRCRFCWSTCCAANRRAALMTIASLVDDGAQSAAFIAANGPVTQQDRWEEDAGYSPFTMAAEISALLIAADMADSRGPV